MPFRPWVFCGGHRRDPWLVGNLWRERSVSSGSLTKARCRSQSAQERPQEQWVAVADDILELQQAFDDAELRGDADRFDALLADDFLSIGEQGYQLAKREWVDRHRDFRYLSLETTEFDVRHYGFSGRWRSGSGRPTRVGGETMHPCSRIPPS
jgi:hypothetical protein